MILVNELDLKDEYLSINIPEEFRKFLKQNYRVNLPTIQNCNSTTRFYKIIVSSHSNITALIAILRLLIIFLVNILIMNQLLKGILSINNC